jgi:hypothetical protein
LKIVYALSSCCKTVKNAFLTSFPIVKMIFIFFSYYKNAEKSSQLKKKSSWYNLLKTIGLFKSTKIVVRKEELKNHILL